MSDGGVIHTNEGFFNQITGSARTVGHTTITSPERDIDGYNITFNNETGAAEGHQGVTINDKKAHRVIKGKDVWYNSNSGHMEGRGDVDIEDKQNDRTIRGQHVVYNATTGEMENYGNAWIDDRGAQRVIKGDTLLYNEKTRMGEAHGRVDYLDRKTRMRSAPRTASTPRRQHSPTVATRDPWLWTSRRATRSTSMPTR